MDISYLYYFKMLAETLNYTKASENLHITQPSLSYAVARMEQELECQLFTRIGRNIALSEDGTTYYPYVCAAIEQLEQGKASIQLRQRSAEITLGLTKTMMLTHFPQKLMDRYIADFPDLKGRISIKTYVNSAEMYREIKGGKLSVGIGLWTDQPDLQQFKIYQRKLCAVIGGNHPLARKKSVCCRELLNHHLILYQTSYAQSALFFSQLAQQEGIIMNAKFVDDYVDIIFYALKNQAVAILPEDSRMESIPCHICVIKDYPYDMNFYMTVKAGLSSQNITRHFYQYCKGIFREIE